MKKLISKNDFKNKLVKWLNKNIALNFKGVILDDYAIRIKAKIPFKMSEQEIRNMDYQAYKSGFTKYLMEFEKQFAFNIYVKNNMIDIWITILSDKVEENLLLKCQKVLLTFFQNS